MIFVGGYDKELAYIKAGTVVTFRILFVIPTF